MIFQVAIIAVFTKYDQFKRNIQMNVEEEGRGQETSLETGVGSAFNDHYLASLGRARPFVRLESKDFFNQFTPVMIFCSAGMHRPDQKCYDLIEVTANALSGDVVALMLMAVQCDNLELSVRQAIKW